MSSVFDNPNFLHAMNMRASGNQTYGVNDRSFRPVVQSVYKLKFINYTKEDVVVKSTLGLVSTFTPSGKVAKVKEVWDHNFISDYNRTTPAKGWHTEVELPEPQEDVYYILTKGVAMVATLQGRTDVVYTADGHPDTVRDEDGNILSVPGLCSFCIKNNETGVPF